MSRKSISGMTALFTVLFLFIRAIAFADSLVSVNDMTYHSPLEEKALRNFSESNYDGIVLLLSVDPSYTLSDYRVWKEKIDSFTDRQQSSRSGRELTSRKFRKIFADYKELLAESDHSLPKENHLDLRMPLDFSDASLFENNVYLLQQLNLSYRILRTEQQYELVVDGKHHNFNLGTITRSAGVTAANIDFKSNYLSFLINRHQIERGLLDDEPIGELFNRYFLPEKIITEDEFIADQYSMMALNDIALKSYHDALNWARKSYYIFPTDESAFLILYSLANVIDLMDTSDPGYAGYLAKMTRFLNQGITGEQITNLFLNLTEHQLFLDGNADNYEKSYALIIKAIDDEKLSSEITFIYNYERGKMLFNSRLYTEAEPFVTNAFSINPEDKEVKMMFFTLLLFKMEEIKTGDNAYSLAKFEDYFQMISDYKNKYNILNKMKGFRQAWLYFCLGLMDQSYKFADAEKGEKYMKIFETDYPVSTADYSALNAGIANAYASAANFYKQNANKDKSLRIVKKGLDYLPEDTTLLSFKSNLNK